MEFEEDFNRAVLAMPQARKDKLLLRLLKQNETLASQLYFELLDAASLELRREEMEAKIRDAVQRANQHYHTPGGLMMDLRYMSGDITQHVKVTKDKFGEVHLNLLLVALTLQGTGHKLAREPYGRCEGYCVYIVAKVFNLLVLMQDFHPDLRYEFKGNMLLIGEYIGATEHLMHTAIRHGLNVNWLIEFDVPDDIAQRQKDLRAMGYLKYVR